MAVQKRVELAEEHKLRTQKSKEVRDLAPALLTHQYYFALESMLLEVFKRQVGDVSLQTLLKLV